MFRLRSQVPYINDIFGKCVFVSFFNALLMMIPYLSSSLFSSESGNTGNTG